MNKKGITGEAGSLWNYPDTSIEKPCTQCTVVAQQAGLEFPDGKNANIDSGLWLHHVGGTESCRRFPFANPLPDGSLSHWAWKMGSHLFEFSFIGKLSTSSTSPLFMY